MRASSIATSLSSQQIQKLGLIQASLEDTKSHQEILNGLIDVGYSNALKNLYLEGLMSHQNYQKHKRQLPSYLRDLMPN